MAKDQEKEEKTSPEDFENPIFFNKVVDGEVKQFIVEGNEEILVTRSFLAEVSSSLELAIRSNAFEKAPLDVIKKTTDLSVACRDRSIN